MLHTLTGKLTIKKPAFIVVEVGGVGFKIVVPLSVMSAIPSIGSSLRLFCHLHVREDALELFGFLKEEELRLFEALISVSSVGPRSAVNIMGVANTEALIAAINEGRTELITKASGIGKKTAERISLELKGKLSFTDAKSTLSLLESDMDLEETLISLGYTKQQAKVAISKIDPKIKDFNERLKAALKK